MDVVVWWEEQDVNGGVGWRVAQETSEKANAGSGRLLKPAKFQRQGKVVFSSVCPPSGPSGAGLGGRLGLLGEQGTGLWATRKG